MAKGGLFGSKPTARVRGFGSPPHTPSQKFEISFISIHRPSELITHEA